MIYIYTQSILTIKPVWYILIGFKESTTTVSGGNNMTLPRKNIVPVSDTPHYHCIGLCIRQAFVCGKDKVNAEGREGTLGYEFSGKSFDCFFASCKTSIRCIGIYKCHGRQNAENDHHVHVNKHQRQWIIECINELSSAFSIDICAYLIMSNHVHLVLRLSPKDSIQWLQPEVIELWQKLYSGGSLLAFSMPEFSWQNDFSKSNIYLPIMTARFHQDFISTLPPWGGRIPYQKMSQWVNSMFIYLNDKPNLSNKQTKICTKSGPLRSVYTISEQESPEKVNSNIKINISKLQGKFIAKVNDVLESVYKEQKITVSMLASAVGMSERQFFRQLNKTLNIKPAEYIRRFKLEKAKLLIIEGYSINYVALETGFSSQSHFGRCFKDLLGCSPKEYKSCYCVS